MLETPSQEEIIKSIQIIKNIRQRPGMYFGSVGSCGVEQFIYELVANVLDYHLADRASFVNVELDGAKILVVDDGPGLPFDEPSDLDGVSLATKFLTNCHFARSEDNHAPHVHMSALGMGLTPLNACSAELKVQSWRSGILWEQNFVRGVAQVHAPTGLQALGYMLIEPPTMQYQSSNTPFHTTLHYENIFIEAVAFGEKRYRLSIFSWVNGVRTPEQGSHVEGFLAALQEVGWFPALGLIHVVMSDPEFAGPMRTKLDIPHIHDAVRSALREPLLQYRRDEPNEPAIAI